jgi:hypothetical protein
MKVFEILQYGHIVKVYAVRSNADITEFLVYELGEWKWKNANNYRPYGG